MTNTERLHDQIQTVAEARREVVGLKEAKDKSYAAWLERESDLFYRYGAATLQQMEAEQTLRDLTLQAYAETQDKHPAPGVDIKETSEMRYDPKEAFAWACKHLMALQLDKKSFEGIAKSKTPPPDLDFVETAVVYQATISQDLEKVLKEELE